MSIHNNNTKICEIDVHFHKMYRLSWKKKKKEPKTQNDFEVKEISAKFDF